MLVILLASMWKYTLKNKLTDSRMNGGYQRGRVKTLKGVKYMMTERNLSSGASTQQST